MRTVSFSSPAVRKTLSDHFICARINTTGDPTAGASYSHAPSDPPGPCLRGNGQQNIQLIFLTPHGEMLHALAGYVGPDELADELKFALATYQALSSQRDDGEQLVREAHARHLSMLGYSEDEIHCNGNDPLGGMLSSIAMAIAEENTNPDKMLGGFKRRQTLHDHRFAMRNALLPWRQFEPEMLVGKGQSFFGSTSSGAPGDRRIGE
jgi:hypothetical protein